MARAQWNEEVFRAFRAEFGNRRLGCLQSRICLLLLIGGALGEPRLSFADDSPKVTQLEQFTVSDVPVEDQILPTVRPVDSVFGDSADILDIPRSVAEVNQAWMKDRQVTNALDFGQFSPGVYSPARYGVPATPTVRGDDAQIYVNGQGTLFTTDAILPSFNGVESMDIVKGPGSAIFGPQSEGAGGYVNFVMKEPYFDHEHTEIDMTAGYLASGHSYSNPELTIDTGGPINSELAYRVSYLSHYGQGYYENEPNQTQDIYAALAFRPNSRISVEGWAQWYANLFSNVSGVNRVTQAFIDHGIYISGQVVAYPDSPPFGLGNVDGSYGLLDPSTAKDTVLPQNRALIAPGDSSRSARFQSQLIVTSKLGPDSSLVNKTYFEDARTQIYNLWGYSSYMPLQESVQDRLEFHDKFSAGNVGSELIAGGDFRYTRVEAYEDYAVEPFFYYDLSQPTSSLVFPAYAQEGNTLGAPYLVPGNSKFGAYLVNDSSNQDSSIYDSSFFIQDHLTLGSHWLGILGLRDDEIHALDSNPPLNQVNNPVTGQLYSPGIYVPKGAIFSASDTVQDPSAFASVVFKPSETGTFYLSYARVNAILGSENYGGVNVSEITDGANTPIGTPEQYHEQLQASLTTRSTLYEAGYKQSFLKNTLFFDAAVYQQLKSEPQIEGPAFLVRAEGVELDAVYQPTKALSLNANFTYQNVTDYGSSFFQQTNNYLDGYPAGFIVDGQSGTGNGSPNYSSVPQNNYAGYYTPPGDRMKAPGVPEVLANIFAQYEWKSGFGLGLGPQIQGMEYANDQDTLHIPAEYELDGFVYFRAKRWDVQINVKNMTNRRLLDPIDVTFAGNDLIFVRPPISASITLRLHL